MITILTWNIWGTPYASDRLPRAQAITTRLLHESPDIILLQEAFLPEMRDVIIRALADNYQHHYYAAGLLGSGLLTLSKFPIRKVGFQRFRLGGIPEDVRSGDYFVGKGVGYALISTPDGDVALYNTHPHAQYSLQNDNRFALYTDTNLYEAVTFIERTSQDLPIIFGGDLNTRPTQFGYQLVASMFQNAYLEKHIRADVTFSADNPYVSIRSQTLDYLFTAGFEVEDIHVCPEWQQADELPALSDHHPVLATLNIAETPGVSAQRNTAYRLLLRELHERLNDALMDLDLQRNSHFNRATIALLTAIDFELITGRLIRRWLGGGRWLRWFTSIPLTIFGIGSLLQATVNLRTRRNTMIAIRDEIAVTLRDQAAILPRSHE